MPRSNSPKDEVLVAVVQPIAPATEIPKPKERLGKPCLECGGPGAAQVRDQKVWQLRHHMEAFYLFGSLPDLVALTDAFALLASKEFNPDVTAAPLIEAFFSVMGYRPCE